jgi:hypothetical protein
MHSLHILAFPPQSSCSAKIALLVILGNGDPVFSASPREDAAQAAVPFLKFGHAIGCGQAIEVRSTRSWSEHDAFAIGTQGSNPLFGQ